MDGPNPCPSVVQRAQLSIERRHADVLSSECVDKPLSFSDEELDELAVLYDRSGQTAVLRGRPHQCRREHDRQVASSHLIHDALSRHSACVPVAHATRRTIQ